MSIWRPSKAPSDFRKLLAGCDVFIQSYRPGALARRGFGPAAAAELRPGIVCVSLSAYGHAGPWAERRGFDSLVQTTTGLNYAEAEAAGETNPRPLPCQAIDHASGLSDGARRDDGAAAPGRARRKLAGAGLAGPHAMVAAADGPRRERLCVPAIPSSKRSATGSKHRPPATARWRRSGTRRSCRKRRPAGSARPRRTGRILPVGKSPRAY